MSTPVPSHVLVEQLQWRYATQKFDTARKIAGEAWQALEQALVLTPSSFGLQPWKFIVVEDAEIRRQLRAASWNQSQITDASHLVVFAIKKDLSAADVERFVNRVSTVRHIPPVSLGRQQKILTDFVNSAAKGFDINAWATRQVYIALGNFMTSAAILGIDACPMEGLEPKQYDAILGLEAQGYRTTCAATAGYRASDDAYASLPKVRYPLDEVITHI